MRQKHSIAGCLFVAMLVTSCGGDPASEAEANPSEPALRDYPTPTVPNPYDIVRPPNYEGLGSPVRSDGFKELKGKWEQLPVSVEGYIIFTAAGNIRFSGDSARGCDGKVYRHQKGYLVNLFNCSDGIWSWWIVPPPRIGKDGRKFLARARVGSANTSASSPQVTFSAPRDNEIYYKRTST